MREKSIWKKNTNNDTFLLRRDSQDSNLSMGQGQGEEELLNGPVFESLPFNNKLTKLLLSINAMYSLSFVIISSSSALLIPLSSHHAEHQQQHPAMSLHHQHQLVSLCDARLLRMTLCWS